MTAARPAIGSPCRSSGGRAVTLYPKAPRHCDATLMTGGPLAGASVCWAEWWNLQRHCLAESSTGVHAGCYTACDVAPVVTRGTSFNGRPAQVDALKRSAGSCASCAAVNPAKREIDARPSTFSFAAEAGKADPRSKPGMNRSRHLAKSVSAKSGSRSCARPAAITFPGNGARGPGVAASKSTVAAPFFHFSSNVHGCALSAQPVGRRGLT